MSSYTVKSYQPGFEYAQTEIGRKVCQDWVWPFAYDLDDLVKMTSRPEFDPSTRLYCLAGDEVVGYLFFDIAAEGETPSANLEFPRMLPGHEEGASLLMERALAVIQQKGIHQITGRVSTMAPHEITLAEEFGFAIKDWGFKLYYSYEMAQGKLEDDDRQASEIDPETGLEAAAAVAAYWYNRPTAWCLNLLREWQDSGMVITHQGVWQENRLVAACMAAPNLIRPATAANYYIYAPDAATLRPLLCAAINRCVDHGCRNLIADLVNEHRPYESLYQELGFHKTVEWGRVEKTIE
jgi:hypothetical protein